LEALFQKYLSTFTTTVLQKILIMWLRAEVDDWRKRARLLGMKLITFPIIHLGTDKTKEVLANMYDTLRNRV